MTLLITGSQGNIGRRLMRAFAGTVGVDRLPGADINVDLADCSYREGAIAEALTTARCVIHLATSADPNAAPEVHLAAVAATARLAEACYAAGVPRIVLPSSDWAEPRDPGLQINAYGYSKRAIEALAAMYGARQGFRAVALRIGWVPGSEAELHAAPDWLRTNYWPDEKLVSAFREAAGMAPSG